ncbi:cation:dicarboxylate symporter family transporter [Psychrobacter sanguinis]|uniref:Cation:dicarboxylase symporter family transporter n=1 Tax=Psychrobacter sanguinis TaxID=861445 RepID=A0A844M230_9GAMM|nr:cation:dicarboxylase symporter family transporter [Psychrobacter sanguinis]MUG32854.1 cation:dicarboxylase symporter family transporter [Psychrobacter sanguinis]
MLVFVLLILFVGLLYGLWRYHRQSDSLSRSVFLGLSLGVIYGLVISSLGLDTESFLPWVNIVGNGYVNLLKMIAMPLVFISILAAIARLEKASMIGSMSFWIISTLIITTGIAAFDGAIIANLFHLDASSIVAGEQEIARSQSIIESSSQVADLTIPGLILSFIPTSIGGTLAGLESTSMISAVVIASLLGIAALTVNKNDPEKGAMIIKGIDIAQSWVMALVRLIIRLTPYGILALMIKVIVTTDAGAIWQLAKFLIASYVALFIMLIVHALIITLTGRSPISHFKKIAPVLTFAFTSRSSAATIPLSIDAQVNELGIAKPIANFSASFGSTIGQNGCAGVYPAMLAMMIAPTMGIDPWSMSFIASVVGISMIASFGVAGVGGGATFAAIIVLSTLGMPLELAGLLISIEPLIDMMRTLVNVSGSITAGVVGNKVLGDVTHHADYQGQPS